MCFSATASFTAAAFCGVIGAATIRRAEKRDLMLAALPLIFAAHQALEGIVWLTDGTGWGRCSGYGFVIIAFCMWPAYIPLAVWLSESSPWRRKILIPFLALGAFLAIAAASVLHSGLTIDTAAHHVIYGPGRRYPLIFDYLYAFAVLGPLLIYRNIYLRLFAGLIALFFAFSTVYFNPERYSIWCFFAALSSPILYLFVTSRHPAKQ